MEWIAALTVLERILLLVVAFVCFLIVMWSLKGRTLKFGQYEFSAKQSDIVADPPEEYPFETGKEIDFSSHSLFSRIRTFTEVDINNFHLKSEVRDLVFKDMVRIVAGVYERTIQEYLPKFQAASSRDQLRHEIVQCIVDGTAQAKVEFQLTGVPEIIIRKFTNRINIFQVFLVNYTNHANSHYRSKNEMIDIFLLAYVANIDTLLIMFKSIFDELNGELYGLEYKGMVFDKSS